MTIYILIPFGCLIIAFNNFDNLDKNQYKNRVGEIYDGLKIKNGKKVLSEPSFFFLRRLGMAGLVLTSSIDELIV